ncbi:hypothetical protein F5876DRAFT_76082 [Lentinula aff. lateritia]|uniref:Uncharacterized protein n=1 Tax=Lentinula aff. lateritia TaxID=2804960 RepID=A0ACC1U270_9AGAR|nr:hypothetical protein F5876DRAFT_76082 [Lentinula aff. lateritia]
MSESLQLAVETQIGMNWNYYIELVESTIVIYDYLLTFDTEVERYWKQETRFSFATTLFYMNRYLNLLGLIPVILFDFWPNFILHHKGLVLISYNGQIHGQNLARCLALNVYHWGYIFLVASVIDVLFIIRIYAIYGCSRRIVLYLSVLQVCVAGNSFFQLYLASKAIEKVDYTSPLIDQVGCADIISEDVVCKDLAHNEAYRSTSSLLDMAYSWLGVVIFDVCVFGLTLWKTSKMRAIHGGIGTIVMRDGTMYFGIVTLINSGNITLFFTSGLGLTKGLLSMFCNVAASITMSHLMLNLKGSAMYSGSTIEIDRQIDTRLRGNHD